MAEPTDPGEAETQLAPAGVELGKYVLERRIGEGGMGSVYRARDTRSGRSYAIKVLKEKDPELVRRFLREARIAAALRHPNIVEVHEISTRPGEPPAIVMELLAGESLAAHLARAGRLSIEQVAPIVIAVVRAVQAVHARGVVHRDLKPDNVFLAREGEGAEAPIVVKVLDFGIAKLMPASEEALVTGSAFTRTGQIVGTPQYMAPEVIFGEKDIDARADVWSLGVILYEALGGARPFDGQNVGQVFKAIALEPHVPLATRAPLAPPSVVALVERMLAHARSERLLDLDEVLRVLEPFARANAASTPPARDAARLRPATIALLLGAACACALGGAFALQRGSAPVAVASAPLEPPSGSAPSAVAAPVAEASSAAPVIASAPPRALAPPRPAVERAAANVGDARAVHVEPATSLPATGPAVAAPSAVKHRSGGLQPDEL